MSTVNRVEPLVTLLMPAWNPRREWLTQAVESALGQRECSLELLIVDDGSDDPVEELVGGMDDDRLRVLRVPHRGVSAARNAGIAAARGSHIRFIDADDVVAPDSTARLLEACGSAYDVIAYGQTVVCDPVMRRLWKMTCSREGDVREACLLDRFPVMMQTILFPRRVVERTGEWDTALTVCEDWDFVLRALDHAEARRWAGTALYYRSHPAGASRADEAAWDGTLRVVRGYFERHPERRNTALERKTRAMLEFMQATQRPRREIWRSRHFWRAGLLNPMALVHGVAGLLRTSRFARPLRRL